MDFVYIVTNVLIITIQKQAMRIALRLRRPAPSYMLYELLDAKPIKRLEECNASLESLRARK